MPKLTVVQNAEGKPCIVSSVMHAMLAFIQAHPEAMYEEIADHVGFNRPSTNTYCSRMEKANLIQRKTIKVDGRTRVVVSLCDGVCIDFDVIKVQ